MNTRKFFAYASLTLIILVAGAVALAAFVFDEEAPDQFQTIESAPPPPPECYTDENGTFWCDPEAEAVIWEPYCVFEEDQFGSYYQCYDEPEGERLCPMGDGPYWDEGGYPYYYSEPLWQYCDYLSYLETGGEEKILGVKEEFLGAASPFALFAGKSAFTRILHGNKEKRVVESTTTAVVNHLIAAGLIRD